MNVDAIVSLLNDDLKNERKHLNFYLYHTSAIVGPHALEFREWLEDAAKGEMAHVLAFQDRVLGLGGELGTEAHDFPLLETVDDILLYARRMENEVVENYTERLKYLEQFASFPPARYLQIFYEDQLKDSYEDCERISRMAMDTRVRLLRRMPS